MKIGLHLPMLAKMGNRKVLLFSRCGTVPACDRQTDRQTDVRTHDDSIYRATITTRGKNGSRDSDHAPFRNSLLP